MTDCTCCDGKGTISRECHTCEGTGKRKFAVGDKVRLVGGWKPLVGVTGTVVFLFLADKYQVSIGDNRYPIRHGYELELDEAD